MRTEQIKLSQPPRLNACKVHIFFNVLTKMLSYNSKYFLYFHTEYYRYYFLINYLNFHQISGGGQNLEHLNVEWPIFQISEISNIKRRKDELFDFIIFDLKKKLTFA